jgi:hypothetical protein
VELLNLEAGVLRALTAYKIESGLPDAVAARWATANLQEGIALFKAAYAVPQEDIEIAVQAAFAALKTWAQPFAHVQP